MQFSCTILHIMAIAVLHVVYVFTIYYYNNKRYQQKSGHNSGTIMSINTKHKTMENMQIITITIYSLHPRNVQ